ncbi:MAG: universal stress protein [Verrucomicrobia bacterium]|nr:universal stress protein [Verrucomicrobiota bacterium]
MNIICGTDFSDTAKAGATVAAVLAHKLNDRLLLVHALPAGGQGAASPEVMNALFANLHEMLAEEVARLRRLGAAVESHLVTGCPEPALLSKVLPGETRLVVVGSQGRLASNHRLVGGVGERVAESSPLPTLVVRQAEPYLEWARGGRPLRVVCAYDFSATADAALTWLDKLRCWGPCELVVAEVDSSPDENARLGIPGPAPFDGNEPEVQRILERDLREKANAVLGDAGARIRVQGTWGRPDNNLIEIANQERADLLLTGTHQRHGLERLFHVSVSRAMLRHAPMSVLVVPAGGERVLPPATAPHRVLVATDFSAAGNQAVRQAYSLLNAGGTVLLAHVVHPQALPNGQYEHGIGDRNTKRQHAEYVRLCTDQLRSLVPTDAVARGIVTEVEVLEHRKPAVAITQAAERFGADVICLGTHGHSRFSAAAGNSVTQTIMRRSTRPLLVAHTPPG